MTEAEYCSLTNACDALLRAPEAGPDRIALSWLHVLSEHPNNLGKYEGAFRRLGWGRAVRTNLRHSASLTWTMAQSLWSPAKDWITPSIAFPAQVDLLLISHLVSEEVRAGTPDFYYGSLPEELASCGVTSLLALHNHVSSKERQLRERLSRGGATSRILLPRWSTLTQECRIARRARRVASNLLKETAATKAPFQKAVAREAALYATAGPTIDTLRVQSAVQQLCVRFKPRVLMVTWEGHAWERLAFHAARCVDSTIRCVGYQHTVLFPRSHALRRSLGRVYDPDIVLTIGDVNRDVLRRSEGLRSIPIVTYGSHRRHGAARPRTQDASTRCLVIPEGLETECLILLDFAIKAAAHLPSLQFILRMHPVLPFDWLVRRNPRLHMLPPNMRVSDHTDITADFARCDWALYRGSSAVVHAVLTGMRPVYVQRQEQLTIDPLFGMKGWRRRVNSVKAFCDLVAADQTTPYDERQREWEAARAFCDRYIVPPNPEVVRALLTG